MAASLDAMHLQFSTLFKKRYRKLSLAIQRKADDRISLFVSHPFHPLLNNHSVEKRFPGCRSINITGDLRAILKEAGGMVVFVNIGTHSQLYG